MQGIEVTLLRNKQYIAQNSDDYKVIGNENNATTIIVHFPDEYENYSKRVDFKNIRNEKWTIGLYTPEDETITYGSDFDKKNFAFTLPKQVTIKGELKIQFVAYLPDETQTLVPFELLKIDIKDDILYARKEASDTPDLILKAYEYSNMALGLSREAVTRAEDAECAALESEKSAKAAENSAKKSQQSASNAEASARNSNTRATNAEQSASEAQASAKAAENSAKSAETDAKTAVTTSNTANTNSQNAVRTANEANAKSTQTLDIVENLSVSSTEIDCREHISVDIETINTNKHKNIHFKVPAPKQGTSYRSKGAWDSAVQYIHDDYFIDTVGRYGCTYYCKKTNTNQEPLPSEENEYWGLLCIKGSDAGVTIVDNLESTNANYVLSAKQGNVIKKIYERQLAQINQIKNNTDKIANEYGGFSCGNNSTSSKNFQFKNYVLCDENGKIPASRLLDTIYPIGSIYFSMSSSNPSLLFGGTWEALESRLLIGASATYPIGSVGGEASHILTTAEMPAHSHNNTLTVSATQNSHSHGLQSSYNYSTNCNGLARDGNPWSGGMQQVGGVANNNGDEVYCYQASNGNRYVTNETPAITVNHSLDIQNTGGSQAHNNMPPYLAVYMWKRIS